MVYSARTLVLSLAADRQWSLLSPSSRQVTTTSLLHPSQRNPPCPLHPVFHVTADFPFVSIPQSQPPRRGPVPFLLYPVSSTPAPLALPLILP